MKLTLWNRIIYVYLKFNLQFKLNTTNTNISNNVSKKKNLNDMTLYKPSDKKNN